MAEARLETQWDQIVFLYAKLHNVNCAKRSDMISDPSSLNPIRARARKKDVLSLKELRSLTER